MHLQVSEPYLAGVTRISLNMKLRIVYLADH